ncbi:MAG TPA: hypothetical protein VKB93_02345 [Thermoanaerobaculia bacterium]|nr:hypothetical protein [Thermoanaerobaculia bacterium]
MDRARRVQTAQHILGAILLITTAVGHLGHGILPYLELLTGIALIATAIVEKVRKKHTRVGWLELAGAAMMYVEAIAKFGQPHHLSFHILTFVAPTMLLLFGLFDMQIKQAMRFETSEDAFFARMRLFRSHRVPWESIRSFRVTPKHFEIVRHDARVKRLRLSGLHDHKDAEAWLVEQFTKRGVPGGEQTPPTASAG